MVLCKVCNGLQVDSTSNLSAGDTNRPEPQRLRTFVIAETIQDWQRSAKAGCPTCRLVWDTLVRFDRDSVLEELIRVSSSKNYDDAVYLELEGDLGGTLLLEFTQLPSHIEFPTVELYSVDGKHPWPPVFISPIALTTSCFCVVYLLLMAR